MRLRVETVLSRVLRGVSCRLYRPYTEYTGETRVICALVSTVVSRPRAHATRQHRDTQHARQDTSTHGTHGTSRRGSHTQGHLLFARRSALSRSHQSHFPLRPPPLRIRSERESWRARAETSRRRVGMRMAWATLSAESEYLVVGRACGTKGVPDISGSAPKASS